MNTSGQRETGLLPRLSDDARSLACPTYDDLEKEEIWMAGWDEAVRRFRANRWSAFSDEELKELSRFIEHSRIYDTKTKVEDEIEFEQQRRHATGEGEK
jgi:hypothetical protein